jgi:hypothetical protein
VWGRVVGRVLGGARTVLLIGNLRVRPARAGRGHVSVLRTCPEL